MLFSKLNGIVAVVVALSLASCASSSKKSHDLYAGSVKVTNTKANHGGTGIVLRSSDTASLVLTNAHVCGVIENGGLVAGVNGSYMVTGYKKSELADLCLVKVAGNLGYNTAIASHPPQLHYEKASISGHPALMPNVITKGHFSGREKVAVLVGIKKCTEEDAKDERKAAACYFLGGLPIIKEFESILVTATIMPGSSGSGVYNSQNELAGVAFAGSGQIGYAWTVPYEAVMNFLHKEAKTLKYQTPSNQVDVFGDGSGESSAELFMMKLRKVCGSEVKEKFSRLCELADSDLTI